MFRRPAVFFSAFFGVGIFTASQLDVSVWLWMIVSTFALTFFVWKCLRKEKTGTVIAAVIILLAGGLWLEVSDFKYTALENDFGKSTYLEGMITDAEKKDEYCTFILKKDGIGYQVHYYEELEDIDSYIGSCAKIFGEIQEPQGKRNPGCFDYRLYLKSCGTGAVVDAVSIEKTGGREILLLKTTAFIRNKFEERLSSAVSEDARGLITAMAFGDKTYLDENTYMEFQQNGTAHVLAVSGLHVGVLYGFFVFLWRWKKGTAFYVITLAILLMYTALAEFSPSVVRAAVMITIHAVAGITKRRYDLLSAAGITFTAMLLIEPFQLFNAGFQLSFIAVASLGIVLPFIKNFYSGIFLVSLAVQVGMMPYTAYLFNYISIGTVFINVPIVFISGVLLPMVFCLIPAMALPGNLFEPMAYITEALGEFMMWVNHLFYADGSLSFDVVSPPAWSLVMYYGMLLLLLSEPGQLAIKRQRKDAIFKSVVAVIVMSVAINVITDDGFGRVSITFVDVGQGDCIHVKTPDGKNYLIDGGGSDNYDVGMKTLKPYLLKNGVQSVDAAFVTHLHEDHYGGIRSLADDGMIRQIGVYEGNSVIEQELKKETSTDFVFLYAGQRIKLGDDVYLEILAPERKNLSEYEKMMVDKEDENKSSLIFKLIYEDTSVLITGDIDSEGEAELLKLYGRQLDCDVLKAAHHGSKYSSSSEFLAAVRPEIAVFQVGRNTYGHPTEEAIDRCEAARAEIYRNDTDGAVGMEIKNDGKIKVVTMID